MNRKIVVEKISDIDILEDKLVKSAKETHLKLTQFCNSLSEFQLLYQLKFCDSGRDPLENRNLNLIEQLNQQFTYKLTFIAAKWLLKKHPNNVPLILCLGTESGTDIFSKDGVVAAEVFTTSNPKNNQKMKKDIIKVSECKSQFKYVFYHSPIRDKAEERYKNLFPDVDIVFIEGIE
ncbi:hypothetical protein [Cellulosilyticum sp. I15G10I2]|uniref:hypothetical protein n=1 Tax=Cellulosilyticum sp. I15G10I2 TaxID=1892843 RepID=UPI00085C7EFB|nr:hypothetical protein [Cellulosilyticum sp. I15G10I2]